MWSSHIIHLAIHAASMVRTEHQPVTWCKTEQGYSSPAVKTANVASCSVTPVYEFEPRGGWQLGFPPYACACARQALFDSLVW